MYYLGSSSVLKKNMGVILSWKNQKIYFESSTCPTARFDTVLLINKLIIMNTVVSDPKKATKILFTACVTTPKLWSIAEERIDSLKRKNLSADVFVGGCGPLIHSSKLTGVSFFDWTVLFNSFTNMPCHLDDISILKLLRPEQTLKNVFSLNAERARIRDELCDIDPRIACVYERHTNGFKFINSTKPPILLRISVGCSEHCAFCNETLVRGPHISIPIEKIMASLTEISSWNGNILLIASNTGAYGLDRLENSTNPLFDDLLDIIAEKCKDATIVLRYLHPKYLLKYFNTIHKLVKEKRITYIDVPIQTGSEYIMKKMNRGKGYLKEFIDALTQLRKSSEELQIKTCFIVGFPGETHSHHRQSISLIKSRLFDFITFMPMSINLHTAAAKMKCLPKNIIQKRLKEMHEAVLINRMSQIIYIISDILPDDKNKCNKVISLLTKELELDLEEVPRWLS